jgi:hypothetical protein
VRLSFSLGNDGASLWVFLIVQTTERQLGKGEQLRFCLGHVSGCSSSMISSVERMI